MEIVEKLHNTLFANHQVRLNNFSVLDDQERVVEIYDADKDGNIIETIDITYQENGHRIVHTNNISNSFESWEYYNENNKMTHYEDSNSIVKEKDYDENGNLIYSLSVNEERKTFLTNKDIHTSIVRVEEWFEYTSTNRLKHYKCEIRSISGDKLEVTHDYFIKNERPCYGKIYGKFYFNRPYRKNKGFIEIHSFDGDGVETINRKQFDLD